MLKPSLVASILTVVSFSLGGCGDAGSEYPSGPHPIDETEWRWYAGDTYSSHYSSLSQITAENFNSLEVAWTLVTPDAEVYKKVWERAGRKRPPRRLFGFQTTPVKSGPRLIGTTQLSQVFAVDAGTGDLLWLHDPKSYEVPIEDKVIQYKRSRGVALAHLDRSDRIYFATQHAYLIALDAKTGKLVSSFGDKGRVDLMEGLRRPARRLEDFWVSSPPVICGDTVVVGGSVTDTPRTLEVVPGDIRGYDLLTGELKWTFHVVPEEGEFGVETWENGSWRQAGASNAWGPMSADPELGYVYAVTGTPSNDHYGGHRLGDNLFAETLLCLDAETGERIWHYQLVRHGLWDYDVPAPPNLVDLTHDGRKIKAVAQVTKQGFCFVFDRTTGEPLWPIEDRAVPASDVPGERTSPTQPFPTAPPPFELQGVYEKDLIDFTLELREKALKEFRRYRSGPLFSPPSLEGTIMSPGSDGGANWQGAGFDPHTAILYVPSVRLPRVAVLAPSSESDTEFDYFFVRQRPLEVESGLSILKPPYSQLSAIDLNSGELLWQVPNGDGPRDHPAIAHLELPPLGSGGRGAVLITPTLGFLTEGANINLDVGGPHIQAFDKTTGEMLGKIRLPARTRGCPMTYLHEGKQFIVVAVGERGVDAQLVALALP